MSIFIKILIGLASLTLCAQAFSFENDRHNKDTSFHSVSGLGLRAVIDSVEKGDIEALWYKGGEAVTARGDRAVWGYFYANPNDVSWGSIENPDLFVKIWFDVSGRTDVNYFHVSVPDIKVYTAFFSDASTPNQSSTTTMERRYIRHYIKPSGNDYAEENYEDGFSPAMEIQAPAPIGFQIINGITIGSQINTVEKGWLEGDWQFGGQSTTSRGDEVVWGYFSADPTAVSWGNPDNPEVFVKIWFDKSGRIDVNYFHVSVPDIGIYSGYLNSADFDRQGVTILEDRYTRHEFIKTTKNQIERNDSFRSSLQQPPDSSKEPIGEKCLTKSNDCNSDDRIEHRKKYEDPEKNGYKDDDNYYESGEKHDGDHFEKDECYDDSKYKRRTRYEHSERNEC